MRRRDFVKASALTAGATVIEGCTDEEHFIIQQVRQTTLPGETVWRPGVCRQCAAGCGIQVRVVDGNAKKIEGNEAHPVNRGGVCALGHSLLQELYNPDRVLQPQRLAGARGSGSFEVATWDDAMAAAVQAVSGAAPDRIGIVARDGTGLTGALWRRFASALAAPAPTFLEAPETEVERLAARVALGTDDYPHFDIARAELVLSIGAPFADRWRSPVHYIRALAEMRRGRATRRGRLIQAEARMSLTAANADVWLPIQPGTEGVLARALAGYLLESGGVAAPARQRYERLFPSAPPTLAEAATACDIREDRLLEVAEELAGAENALVMGGGSAAGHTNGLFNVTAALGLNLLLGNLGSPGGVFSPTRVDLGRALSSTGAATPASRLAERLRDGAVDVLIVADADPVHTLPGGFGIADAIAGVETVIVLGSSLDDTAVHADLLLPISTELERFEAAEPGTTAAVAALGMTEPVIEPMGESRHPADVLIALASGLGGGVAGQFPWSDFEEVAEASIEVELARLPGGSGADASDFFDEALERGGVFGEGDPAGAPPGPSGAGPQPAGGRFEGAPNDYPFVLLPFESVRSGTGRAANRPWMQELPDPLSTVMWNCWVEIAPADAEELGIHDQDLLRITSPQGSIELHAVVDPASRPGVVSVPLGHGHSGNGRYAEGRGANVLTLVGSSLVDGTSAPAWAATRVHIERLGEGELVRFGRSYEDMGHDEVIPVGWAPHEPLRKTNPEKSV
ncbi:MAG: molybdopterin-dependent oxidoreductase [Gemmatimonadota bacterium]|nr:molybdopterin-dependent oxidoreductase [Gemmatimonadota bacterium]